jgi:hypothetical protein
VLVQIGAFFWPALLPQMIPRWSLTNSEAGWITAAFYGAYIFAVPVLVTLTDRIDAKLVYLSRRRRHGRGPRAVRRAGGRLLVGARGARAHRRRLGRHLHDRAEAARRQSSTASCSRAQRQGTQRASAYPARCRLPAPTCSPASADGGWLSMPRRQAPRSRS